MPPEEKTPTLSEVAVRLSGTLLGLDPGDLAHLHHMVVAGPGEIAFWKIATKHGLTRPDDKGLRLVKILALLTPKGEPGHRRPFHDPKRPLGLALCDADLSEARLARFLALPFDRRGDALERMARRLAASRDFSGVDCRDIAHLLFSDDVKWPRKLAADYYRRLDAARPDSQKDDAA